MLPTEECKECSGESKAPTIKLNGLSTIKLRLNETYTEAGATASDEEDGDLTSQIETSGKVDTTKAGTYTITYKVKDSSGKEAKVTRKVIVEDIKKPDSENTTTNNTTNETE